MGQRGMFRAWTGNHVRLFDGEKKQYTIFPLYGFARKLRTTISHLLSSLIFRLSSAVHILWKLWIKEWVSGECSYFMRVIFVFTFWTSEMGNLLSMCLFPSKRNRRPNTRSCSLSSYGYSRNTSFLLLVYQELGHENYSLNPSKHEQNLETNSYQKMWICLI